MFAGLLPARGRLVSGTPSERSSVAAGPGEVAGLGRRNRAALEMRSTRKRTGGSNPYPSSAFN